nr:hypothetical protein [Tanacetum cinerariifolium]
MSWTGVLEFADDTVTDYSRPSPTIESTSEQRWKVRHNKPVDGYSWVRYSQHTYRDKSKQVVYYKCKDHKVCQAKAKVIEPPNSQAYVIYTFEHSCGGGHGDHDEGDGQGVPDEGAGQGVPGEGIIAVRKVVKLELEHCASYVLMSNVYGAMGQYEEEYLKKTLGCSWIEFRYGVHVF